MRTCLSLARCALATAIIALALAPAPLHAQQRPDPDFHPEVAKPAFSEGTGPVVLIDEAHNNFHTATGRYAPFAELITRDGFQVRASDQKFTQDALAGADILVVANALSDHNAKSNRLPTYSAFTANEVAAVEAWVREGGALLLIADHMPWGGSAAALASAFGLLFADGYALSLQGGGVKRFDAESGLAPDHPAVSGREADESVGSVMTFTGQAFRVRRGTEARELMTLGDDMVLLMPSEAWKLDKETPRLSASGMLQGATLEHGAGRVAVFGEAAMFSAQISSRGGRMGMNHPDAGDNAQFALNVMHWLAGLL